MKPIYLVGGVPHVNKKPYSPPLEPKLLPKEYPASCDNHLCSECAELCVRYRAAYNPPSSLDFLSILRLGVPTAISAAPPAPRHDSTALGFDAVPAEVFVDTVASALRRVLALRTGRLYEKLQRESEEGATADVRNSDAAAHILGLLMQKSLQLHSALAGASTTDNFDLLNFDVSTHGANMIPRSLFLLLDAMTETRTRSALRRTAARKQLPTTSSTALVPVPTSASLRPRRTAGDTMSRLRMIELRRSFGFSIVMGTLGGLRARTSSGSSL